MKNKFRKIVLNNKEYDWRYVSQFYYNSNIQIYEIYYQYNNRKNVNIRKRSFLKEFEVNSAVRITPMQVEELMRCGQLLTPKSIRRRKLEKINKIRYEN